MLPAPSSVSTLAERSPTPERLETGEKWEVVDLDFESEIGEDGDMTVARPTNHDRNGNEKGKGRTLKDMLQARGGVMGRLVS